MKKKSDFRALCFGTEIDVRVIKGLGVGRKNKQSKACKKRLKIKQRNTILWIFLQILRNMGSQNLKF